MIERVRPAQLITIVVPGSGAIDDIRSANSPFGQHIAFGILIFRNSETGRPSITTMFSLFSRRRVSSRAVIVGVWYFSSMSSPNALLGVLTPSYNSSSVDCQEWMPPSRIFTFI